MKDGPDDRVLPPEMWQEEHTLNTQYVRGCVRTIQRYRDEYVEEYGRMPDRETFRHYEE